MNSGKLLLTIGLALCVFLPGSARGQSPVYRPLVEEYTGFWCGWCPAGYVMMEAMKERDPERFVGVSYHYNDVLACVTDFPNRPGGYPAVFIDRDKEMAIAKVYTEWESLTDTIAAGDISVEVEWKDKTCKALTATTKVCMFDNYSDADLRISYMLTADGLSDPSWRQHNSYSGLNDEELKEYPEMQNEWGDIFVNGAEWVEGLVFNDIIIGTTISKGIARSLPSEIKAGEELTHIYDFKMTAVRDQNLLQHPELLRIVAVLVDASTEKVLNCAKSGYSGMWENGITEIDEEPVKTEWFDMQGIKLQGRPQGIGIKVVTYPSGKRNYVKSIGY